MTVSKTIKGKKSRRVNLFFIFPLNHGNISFQRKNCFYHKSIYELNKKHKKFKQKKIVIYAIFAKTTKIIF